MSTENENAEPLDEELFTAHDELIEIHKNMSESAQFMLASATQTWVADTLEFMLMPENRDVLELYTDHMGMPVDALLMLLQGLRAQTYCTVLELSHLEETLTPEERIKAQLGWLNLSVAFSNLTVVTSEAEAERLSKEMTRIWDAAIELNKYRRQLESNE